MLPSSYNNNLGCEGMVYIMKIAVLGTGFGAYHVEMYKKTGLVEEIIVWGRNEDKLAELQTKFGVDTTLNLEDIWKDQSISMVDICLPNILHREMAEKALKAGKDVFLEMPIAETVEDGRKIMETAKECKKRVFVDLFLRHEFAYEYLATLVKDGDLGSCKELYIKRQTPPWWGNLDTEHIGVNLMHHDIDFMIQLLGKPTDLQVSSLDICEQQSVVTASFLYQDCFATVHASSAMPQTAPFCVGYEAVFDKGFIRYYEDGYSDGKTDTKLVIFTEEKKEEIELQTPNCYEDVCRDVITSLKEEKKSLLDGEFALDTLEVISWMNEQMKDRKKRDMGQ